MKQYYEPQKITILYSPEKTDYVIDNLHYNSVICLDNSDLYSYLRLAKLLRKKFNNKYNNWKVFYGFNFLKKAC